MLSEVLRDRWLFPATIPTGAISGQPGRRVMRAPRAPKKVVMAMRPERGAVGNRMFVFGTGFVGRYVSDRLIREGWQVSGTCTSEAKRRELEEMGLDAFVFDATKSKLTSLHALPLATHLLVTIPPIGNIGDPLLCLHQDLRTTLGCANLEWLCYLSSTSVYGDCGGAWVDENYPAHPKTESAKLRLAAEEGWLNLAHNLGITVYVFRLGGIYGPGRSALDTIMKGNPLSQGQQKRMSRLYTARIHVADIYQAIKASFGLTSVGKLFNIVDDDPAPREEVFAFAADLVESRWPGFLCKSKWWDMKDAPTLKMGDSRAEKRVSNARLKKELGVDLMFPTYRLGLQNIIESVDQIPKSYENF